MKVIQVEMTEEEYRLFQSLKLHKEERARELEKCRLRAKEFKERVINRLSEYGIKKNTNTAYQYVRGTIKIRLGMSRMNGTQGLSEKDFNSMIDMLNEILPEQPFND